MALVESSPVTIRLDGHDHIPLSLARTLEDVSVEHGCCSHGHTHSHGPTLETPATLTATAEVSEDPVVDGRHELLALGNATIGAPELVAGVMLMAPAAALDGAHNVLDTPGYLKQLRLIAHSTPEGERVFNTDSRFAWWSRFKSWIAGAGNEQKPDMEKLEKSSFRWISLPAIGAAALAAGGVVREMTHSTADSGISFWDLLHLGAAGGALGLAGTLTLAGIRMARRARAMPANPDLQRHVGNFYSHAKLDLFSSGAAVVEALAHLAGIGPAILAIDLGIIAIAGAQAWKFRPSQAGKPVGRQEHKHHEHGDHDGCDHRHLVSHDAMEKATALLRRASALGSAALTGAALTGRRTIQRGAAATGDWLYARQQASDAKRQADNDQRWGSWLNRVSEGSNSHLAAWAKRELAAEKTYQRGEMLQSWLAEAAPEEPLADKISELIVLNGEATPISVAHKRALPRRPKNFPQLIAKGLEDMGVLELFFVDPFRGLPKPGQGFIRGLFERASGKELKKFRQHQRSLGNLALPTSTTAFRFEPAGVAGNS